MQIGETCSRRDHPPESSKLLRLHRCTLVRILKGSGRIKNEGKSYGQRKLAAALRQLAPSAGNHAADGAMSSELMEALREWMAPVEVEENDGGDVGADMVLGDGDVFGDGFAMDEGSDGEDDGFDGVPANFAEMLDDDWM